MIPQSFIDDLVARADIVEIVGSRVQLKKSGREWKACCPFHSEKTPSFWVSPEKQFYHCFGCGAHGTALGFLMQHDKLTFPEAVEELAARLGVEVPREARPANAPPRADESQYELMLRVAKFYAGELERDARAQAYVAKRGLTRDSLDKFLIGYAPSSWNDVLRKFGGTEAARRSLAELGLIVERERGTGPEGDRHYDRFRDRLMFPIRDARGRVIAFGGRIIGEGEPKYLNSPETPLFQKGKELYGLYEARQSREPLKQLLIVEGYMDVVRLHQAGITYSVATLGTATTEHHLTRMFKLVRNVVFAFDGDRAGRAAAWRALNNALPQAIGGREIRFLFLPDGHDPDSLVGDEGRTAFEARVGQTSSLSEYLVQQVQAEVNPRHADGLARVADLVKPLLAKLPDDATYKQLVVERIAEIFPLQRRGDAVAELLGVSVSGTRVQLANTATSSGRGGVVRQAVRLIVHDPTIVNRLDDSDFGDLTEDDEAGATFLRQLIEGLRGHPAQSTQQLLERWQGKPELNWLTRFALLEPLVDAQDQAETELKDCLRSLRSTRSLRRMDQLLLKARSGTLDAAEKLELQRLTVSRGAS